MKLKPAMLLLTCMLLAGVSHTQVIDSLLINYNKKLPQEKAYVQFDNGTYGPGQTIFFKAYLMSGTATSHISRNFYIDWYDAAGKLISHLTAPVVYSSAAGSFTIPAQYAGDKIEAVAYTKWMLNFDSVFLFRQKLNVVGAKPLQTAQKTGVPVTNLSFYPEGGDLVENISSLTAFKAINTAGEPVMLNGIVKNNKDELVAEFATVHNGMGSIRYTPRPGETYTAYWKDETGKDRSVTLPAAKPGGVVLSVINGNQQRQFSIERSANVPDAQKKITIVATMNQQVVFRALANLENKTRVAALLPTDNFFSGVLLLTLFDINHKPIAERVLFVNNNEYRVEASVATDTVNLDKRGHNAYEIVLPDSTAVNLSMAVTDAEAGADSSVNIISRLLLSSEIKGYIKNPAYYFPGGEDAEKASQLDLVMLTNGWRRYNWDEIWAGKIPTPKYMPDTSYLTIAGKIDNLNENKIKKAQMVNLILQGKDSSRQFIFSPLKPDGSFEENNLILFDTTKVYYQLNRTGLPGRSQVKIGNNFYQPDPKTLLPPAPPFFITDTAAITRARQLAEQQAKADELIKQSTLQEVVVKTRVRTRLEEMDGKYANGMFTGSDAIMFDVTTDPRSQSSGTVLNYLQSTVAGLKITNSLSNDATVSWRGSSTAMFIDEMPTDAERLNTISMSDVAFIKVFRPPFMGAIGGGAGGAIAVYTRKGDDQGGQYKGLDHVLLPGYSPAKQFYHPNYAEQQQTYTATDFRKTLYWKPYIVTDGSVKKLKIRFYNNDISKSIQVVLEGMSEDGRFIHISKLLK